MQYFYFNQILEDENTSSREGLELSSSTAYILYPFAKLSQRSADNRDILSVPYN